MEDKRYPIELEVITPLSVGAGNDNEWVKGLDFVQKGGKVYVIDMQKVAAAGVDVEALTALFLKFDDSGIAQLLGSKIDEVSRYVFDQPAKTDNNIKAFLRTQFYDKPLVAGSSIKGSVRSALFNYLRTDEEKNEEVFGTMKDGTDFLRFVRISDVEMPSTVLVNTKLFNLRKEGEDWLGGWKQLMNKTMGTYNPVGFNTLYECVAPGGEGLGNILLAGNAFGLLEKYGQVKSPYAAKKRALLNEPITHLFHIVNGVTRNYLQKEHAFFQKYNAERSDEVLDCIESLMSIIPADDSSCLMKMSAGVGFHSITGDWQYDDYDDTDIWQDRRNYGKKKYKSRKIAEYNGRLQLMGFVKLRALDTDEVDLYTQSLNAEHTNIIEGYVASTRQRESERLKQIEFERLRQMTMEAERRQEQAYQEFLEVANKCYNNNDWDEAISNAKAAVEIYPDRSEAGLMIKKCEEARKLDEFRKNEQAAATQKFSQPLSEVIKGKTSAGNLVGTTVKWLKVEGHAFEQSEQTAFINESQTLNGGEKKKLKSRLSDLAKIVGRDIIEKLAKELESD